MKHFMNKFFRFSVLTAAFLTVGSADATAPQNSRAAVAGNVAPARASGREVKRAAPAPEVDGTVASRSAAARTAVRTSRAGTAGVSARTAMATASRNARNAVTISRNANAARMARASATPVRSATNTARANVSRAAMSRATAIFDDVSKIGGGYAQCRESYATCMDQFCAKANDTYRRCFCSERFIGFRDTEDALDQAKILLQKFEDNNLNAVDKTAAEVDAMYSATVGEAAIKNDTSGAAALLAEIGDLISGKKKASDSSKSLTSLDSMSLDFSSDIGDIWGGSSSATSIFGGGSGVNLTELEGEELFNQVHKQCSEMVAESCQSSAVANMAKSSYGIMISQDCNAYEKSIDTKRQQVQNTVRQAEKILREARLEEYRAHNSQDVNECLDKVRSALLADTACGANYKRCLDPTGAYVNQSTGEPIYTQRLFELTNLITLDGASGTTDILSQNTNFDEFLESRKMFATTALDSCRDISDLVWTEFKRAALIEIAQAQDEKLEEVKSSCVDTMRDCYDKQSNALKSFDTTTSKESGAISAYAARSMCQEKVTACASLYGDTDGCEFDGNGKLKAESTNKRCGLSALLDFVDVVDTVRISEGCQTALTSHLKQLCTPTSGNKGYPWNCRLMETGDIDQTADNETNKNSLAGNIQTYVKQYCVDSNSETTLAQLDERTKEQMTLAFNNLKDAVSYQLEEVCKESGGIWAYGNEANEAKDVAHSGSIPYMQEFYKIAFGGDTSKGASYGYCIQDTVEMQCQAQDAATGGHGYAKYNETTKKCEFSTEWYQNRCNAVGGYWEDDTCYIATE